MTQKSPYVFISYRRKDTGVFAHKLYDRLQKERRLKGRVFFDQSAIGPGEHFDTRIGSGLRTSHVVLVLIGPAWTTILGDDQQPRIKDDADWVVREIAQSLISPQIEILPILVNKAAMPKEPEVAGTIASLIKKQAQIDEQLEEIVTFVKKHIPKRILYRRELTTTIATLLTLLIVTLGGLAFINQDERTTEAPRPTNELPTPPELPITLNLGNLVFRENGLVVVTQDQQPVLWGYGYESGAGVLYAVDVATARQIPPKVGGEQLYFPLTTDSSQPFLPGVIGYDGRWLWVGDLGTNELVAFDPSNLIEQLRLSLPGQPIELEFEGDTLWVATQENDHVLALNIDHVAKQAHEFCQLEVDAPIALESDGGSAIWVLYGPANAGIVGRIATQECQIRSPLELASAPGDLAINDNDIWVLAGGKLHRIGLDNPTEITAIKLNNNDFEYVQTVGDDKLLLARPTSVIVYDIAQSKPIANLPLNNVPQSVVQFGAQTWVTTVRGELLQYVIPTYTIADLVDMVAVQDTLWTIDEVGNVCALHSEAKSCFGVTLDGTPKVLAASNAPDQLWISTENATLWKLDTRSKHATLQYTLEVFAHTLAEEILDESIQRLWFSNLLGVGFVDLTSGEIQAIPLGFNERPPANIAYDGTSLWFSYAGSSSGDSPTYIELVSYRPVDNSLDSRTRLEINNEITAVAVSREALYIGGQGLVQVAAKNPLTVTAFIGAGQNLNRLTGGNNLLWGANTQSGIIYPLNIAINE